MDDVKILSNTDLYRALYTGELAGLDFGVPLSNSWEILSLFRLGHRAEQSFYVSDEFRKVAKVPATRTESYHLYIRGDQARLVRQLETRDEGVIPVLYGSIDIYPLDSEQVHEDSVEFFKGTNIEVVDCVTHDFVISDLQDYKIPSSIKRDLAKMKTAGHKITLKYLHDLDDMSQMYSSEPTDERDSNDWVNAHIHTRLHFGGFSCSDAIEARMYEQMFMEYHNMYSLMLRDMEIHSSSRNHKYAVLLNDCVMGAIDLNVSEDDSAWHWCNTHRIRFGYGLEDLGYNINNVILANLIEVAQIHGAEKFNLGQSIGYDYKNRFKPGLVSCKGLRYV